MNRNPGQKHLQDMMARSQKQKANQQKRNMQAAWMQKQQEKARQQDETDQGGASSGGAPTKWQGGGYFQADERFSKVEDEVASLKNQLKSGRLSEEKFQDQLNNLMVEDDNGDWWMIGTKSDAWYRFDGQNWAQSTPPGRWCRVTAQQLVLKCPERSKNLVQDVLLELLSYSFSCWRCSQCLVT